VNDNTVSLINVHAHVYAECMDAGYINVLYTGVLGYGDIFSGHGIKVLASVVELHCSSTVICPPLLWKMSVRKRKCS